MIKVGDLVEIPEIKTVIQLKDLQDPKLRQMILLSFVVTAEVQKNLEMILSSLSGKEGRGAFLKGHFGSGKSHFLSMLSLLLRYPGYWDILHFQSPSLEKFQKNLPFSKFLVVEISLIQHRGTEFLEDVFLQSISRELALQTGRPFEPAGSRHETFQEIRRTMEREGFSKLVLLVDELSEFLRSKTDAHAYQEDIRFLQYIGEEAFSFPLWIIASLQEWIEETGEINQDTFNKIKDRYPVRISLGRTHLEELISHRLIRQREGAEDEICKIFQALRRYFPHFPVDETRFLKLYPVHPATVTLLDSLKPLFSEHRGMVDFIHFRLQGDLERGIPSFLEKPAQELLGPSTIFDHFVHRIRETAETQPFVDKVFDYYQDEIPQLFADPEKEKVALEAVKLLILLAISPKKVRYSTRHLADMILYRVTELESEINYQYLHEILHRLIQESPYLAVTPGKDPLEDHFSIKLQPDLASIMRQRVRQGASEIFPGDRRLFDRLLPLAESLHLPFAGWAEQRQQRVSILWEYTRRQGTIYLRPLDDIGLDEIETRSGEWKHSEEDFFIFVAPTYRLDQQYQHLRENLLPKLRRSYPGNTFLFWLPAVIAEEEEWMKGILSALLLLESYQKEFSETGQQMKGLLEDFLAQGRKKLGDIFNTSYFNGLLIWDDRQVELFPYGYLSQEKFLEEFVPPLLSRRFPKHHRIHPYIEALAPTTIPNLLNDFFATGSSHINERTQFGLRVILDNLLKPMGLTKKKGNQYLLHVDPRNNELAETCLAFLNQGPLPLETLYWSFRKGDYGLLRHQYEVLLLALLFSGHILALQGQRKKGLEDISRTGLQGITAIDRGKILDEGLRRTIAGHPLIPETWRKGTLTLPAQEALWNEIRALKVQEEESLRNLLTRIEWASSFQAFKNLSWETYRQDVQDVLAQWEEVKVSFGAKEGLERFLSAANREPFLSDKLARLEEIRAFFEEADKILFVFQYLSDTRLSIPDLPASPGLLEDQKDLLNYFEGGRLSIDPKTIQSLLDLFQDFRERYIQTYVEAHQKARSGDQFKPYEKLSHSRRYQLLSRLDQLEMISVQHDLSSINNRLSGVLLSRCETPSIESLQRSPVCRCGFQLNTETRFVPARQIEESVDLGIRETLEALGSPTYQEKLLPFLKGLEEVGETEKASAIRRVLNVSSSKTDDLLSELDQALTPLAVQGINEAFRGRVVVINRDLDQLYQALIRRKYTLPQLYRIIREWLKEGEILPSTFIHFLGRGEAGGEPQGQEKFPAFVEAEFPHLLPLMKETGRTVFKQAVLLSLWIEGYGLSPQKIIPLFPSLRNGEEERDGLLIAQLSLAARLLRQKEPALFEEIVEEVEKEEEFPARAWRLLDEERAADVFGKETLFVSILREAFERILALPEEEKTIGRFSSEDQPPLPAGSSNFNAKQARMAEALKDYDTIRQKALILKRRESNPPQDFQKWESFYLQHLSPLAYLLATFPVRLERMDVNIPSPVRERLAENEKGSLQFFKQFAEFYRQALPLWESEAGKRPKMVEDLLSRNFCQRNLPEGGDRIFLFLDGMRWDLWEYLKEEFFGPLANQFRILQEGALWAHFPSSTTRQLEFFNQAAQKTGDTGFGAEPTVWKIGGIDERVHTEKGTLEHLFRNVRQYLQLELAPRLRELPPRTSLILFSDHGFIENQHFEKSDKYRTSRYIHGEASPLEIIVPWATLVKM